MFQIRRYTTDRQDEWNEFVARSKNGTFLFDRHYMDYHKARFCDHSLMCYDNRGLFALLPANADGDTLRSHQGLTYGGLLMDQRATTAAVCQLFREINDYLRGTGFQRVEYKPVPWIYHRLPSEEDLYALFIVCQARLTGRDISSTISPAAQLKWSHGRRYAASVAAKQGVEVSVSDHFGDFWPVLMDNLWQRYGIRPVHSLEEITLLHGLFPDHIRLYLARWQDRVVGGTVLYLCDRVAHAQYISATSEGKRLHAVDALYERILLHDFADVPFFDFGKSTTSHGYDLNARLAFQKEGFGGRGLCYDTYEWSL